MFYYMYQITNLINGKIYIGVHATSDLNDGYMGSGKNIIKAIKKYGKLNFRKEILSFFSSIEEMMLAEQSIVNEEFLTREDVYNIVLGGLRGGIDYLNSNGLNLYGKNGTPGFGYENLLNQPNGKKLKDLLIERDQWDSFKKNLSIGVLRAFGNGFKGGFANKIHSDESKKLIGIKNSIHQQGKGNSQFGTKWIHDPISKQNKKIKNDDEIPTGWVRGRIMKNSSQGIDQNNLNNTP